MIMLLALPVIAAVALAHRYLVLYAPSNVLIRRVRATAPALRPAAAMLAVASSLIVALRVVSDAVAAGAPGWLNLVVLVLAWDAIKFTLAAAFVALGALAARSPPLRQLSTVRPFDWAAECDLVDARATASTASTGETHRVRDTTRCAGD